MEGRDDKKSLKRQFTSKVNKYKIEFGDTAKTAK